jgi:two-component system sensor histidine kinase KdpD
VRTIGKNKDGYWRQVLLACAGGLAIGVVTFAGYTLHFNAATIVLLYLLIVVWQSLAGGFAVAVIVSLAAAGTLDYFFLPPVLSLQIADPLNVLAFVVFLVISLVINRLVSRLRAEAHRAQRRGANLEQLHQVTRELLLAAPDQIGAASLVKTLRHGFAASAVCLFDAGPAELHMEGSPQADLAKRTRNACMAGKDADDATASVVVRCLRVGNRITGAIGFEGLSEPEWIAAPLAVLAAAVLQHSGALRKASREIAAAQAEVFRTAILDALGHEFKTPLATVLAVVGGLRESRQLGPEEVEMTELVESEVSRLSSLTDRLLRVARLDREEVKPRMRRTDILALVGRVIVRCTAQSSEHEVAVSCQGNPPETLADRQLLDLAFTQLLDNAFKYSVPGTPVTVAVGMEPGFINLRVRNEGRSIAPQEQDRIFERFYRGSAVRNLVTGAGLGLYVARKIAVAHGGSLVIDETASPGTVTFCLKLPAINSHHTHVNNTD